MAVPYFNPHSLSLNAQKAYGPAISNSGSVLNHCSRCSGLVFGLEVQQIAPSSYLNTANPGGGSFHNPFNDYRFPKVLVRVLYHREPEQGEPLGSSNKTRTQHSDENIIYTGQSGLRINQAWNMAVEVNSQPHFNSANPYPHDSILKDTAGNGFSGMGRLTPQASSVVDNTSQKASRIASRRAYEESDKGKAARKAYRESDIGRAYQKAYQKAYHKAYREVFKNTGDREQAKIAGRLATASIRKSNKTKSSEIGLRHGQDFIKFDNRSRFAVFQG